MTRRAYRPKESVGIYIRCWRSFGRANFRGTKKGHTITMI